MLQLRQTLATPRGSEKLSGVWQALHALWKKKSLCKILQKQTRNEASKELAYRSEDISDTSSQSNDESTCKLETVKPMRPVDNRTLRKVIISGASITVLLDSGATISAMDEATFQRYGLENKVKIKKNPDAK